MKLSYTCSACKKQNTLKEKENTRAELQMKLRGDEVHVNCQNCGKMDKKHLNRITAIVDNRIVLLGVGLGIISTIVLWSFLGAIAVFTFSIPIMFWRHDSEKAHKFNSYIIKRN
ncbi:hypothetical protein [Maribacter sp. HTCC2170]|uniref:hypothetical protein n=1 Tax=Maribacter sp. (strain HTCC2170 / KCCM 42371) TaxID=313603 RepID=UPI00006BD4CC|nr:hypothetical protein [Maribacter sp. HTCC2170]EAR02709.1 hypothetical protein FB2170_05460 [Maribacter sp. HTCC2170]